MGISDSFSIFVNTVICRDTDMNESNYETPQLEVFILSSEGDVCQTVSEFGDKWGTEDNWDEEEG